MTTGVTPLGFVPKTVQDLISDVEQAELLNIRADLDTSPEEPVGQINGIFCEKLAELWELGALCYNGMSRDSAEGPQLDNVNNLTGTKRLQSSPSYVLQTCVFSLAGTYFAGSLTANVSGAPSVQFSNGDLVTVVLSGGQYVASVNNVVLATNGTLPITVPGIKFFCTADGPTIANSGTLTVITTPVTGWTSTTNPLDAMLGSLVEQDTQYRTRGANEIAAVGSGNPDALRADLLNVPGVIQAFVLENTSNTFDLIGNPPHSFQCVIWDGSSPAASDTTIAQTIWDDKPSGIGPVGSIADGIATDSNGSPHTMPFSRALQQLLYLQLTVTMFPGVSFNSTVALAIKNAIVASTQSQTLTTPQGTLAPNPSYLGLGISVVAEAIKSAVLASGLSVKDVTLLQLDFVSSPTNTANLTVSQLAIALADTSRILVNGI